MATIKLCDWTKQRIKSNEETFIIRVGEDEFEVGEAGRQAILRQLESDIPLETPAVKIVAPAAPQEPAPPLLEAAPPGGLDMEVPGDPFGEGPDTLPMAPQPSATSDLADLDPEDLLEIPDDPQRKLRTPSPRLADRIVQEATRFEEGTLPSLTMGASQQREAMRKLKELEQNAEFKVRKRAPKGFNVRDQRDIPNFHSE